MIDEKIKALGGLEIVSTFETLKNNNFNVDKYINKNDLRLAKEYIDFSIEYGYSLFVNDIVVNGIEKVPVGYDDGTVSVSFIYGWGKGEESIQSTRESLLDQISPQYFVFAEGNPGDYLVINMLKGDVYYYSHDSLSNDGLTLVAHSFEDFIDRLQINTNITIYGEDDLEEDDLEDEWFADDF